MFVTIFRTFSKSVKKNRGYISKSYAYVALEEGRNGCLIPRVQMEALRADMQGIVTRFSSEMTDIKANRVSHRKIFSPDF
jgi:hypothetical protein